MADDATPDHDVVVVGGGPAGSAAAVFTARNGLDTVVFDRGSGALDRCAYLENYLGFPQGVDVETFQALAHDHCREMGATLVDDLVETVERRDDETPGRFRVETQDGDVHTTDYVLAAAWYDASYLRGLDEPAMFSEQEHHGEVEERFDPDYPGRDGRTDVDGLYVASPSHRSAQAIIAAGNGAHVARCLLEDHRRSLGYPDETAEVWDWLRRDSEFSGEWGDRERWREWYDREVGDDHDLSDERYAELRERYLDDAWATRRTPEAVTDLRADGVRGLVESVGVDRVLDAVDDDAIRERAASLDAPTDAPEDAD